FPTCPCSQPEHDLLPAGRALLPERSFPHQLRSQPQPLGPWLGQSAGQPQPPHLGRVQSDNHQKLHLTVSEGLCEVSWWSLTVSLDVVTPAYAVNVTLPGLFPCTVSLTPYAGGPARKPIARGHHQSVCLGSDL